VIAHDMSDLFIFLYLKRPWCNSNLFKLCSWILSQLLVLMFGQFLGILWPLKPLEFISHVFGWHYTSLQMDAERLLAAET
jgi:hypothetical protein